MNLLRNQRLPHIVFLLALAVTISVGSVRVNRRLAALNAADTEVAQLQLALAGVRVRTRALADARLPLRDAREGVAPDRFARYRQTLREYPPRQELDVDRAELSDSWQHEMATLYFAGDVLLGNTPKDIDPTPVDEWFVEQERVLRSMVAQGVRLDSELGTAADEAMATWRYTTNRLVVELVLLFSVMVLACIGYYYVVSQRIRQPLRELASTARAITDGDLEARAVSTGDGPVDALAEDMNVMIDVLVETVASESLVIDELRRKAEDLEAANRHKSRFVANVSHELKTPLNAIIGFADILSAGRHGPLTERQRDYVARIFSAGNHLLAMITDLIDMSKIDVGAVSLDGEPFAVAEVLREVADMVAPQVEAKSLTLHTDWPDDLGELALDRRRVLQIVVNLLSNAVKFTPIGGSVTVTATGDEAGVALVVHDTGIGIAAGDQERIFDDFVQLDSDLHRQHEGTGIGLALSRRLAELMGGSITVASEPGAGSTFTARLPRRLPTE